LRRPGAIRVAGQTWRTARTDRVDAGRAGTRRFGHQPVLRRTNVKILGISAHYHDSAAALVIDGVPVCAVQEERLSRHKNDATFPLLAIESCLSQARIEPG